ncbi:MAG: CRISPR-associated helicase Cas3' [Bacteroidales bacterium]|jgi:CRISPR-associated endonuclease/helicase Cas3|nr:CRISPR-associated helicase Cas3' [Bacteroidales bacterium]MDY0314473.1 CRISPR-associated helicase Cas3' [Bacteroidales bacterium]NLB85690.1 CRISPR-associated helicase Cas3' [Bacteroidales bacterium]
MVDVNKLKSHSNKLLFTHVEGVLENVKKITAQLSISKIAELAAIFHDLGKINPYFQQKLLSGKSNGYSHHAYLSAFVFYAFCVDKKNIDGINNFFGKQISKSDLIALLVIIAKHHGNLPDFRPVGNLEAVPYIISKDEIISLFNFLDDHAEILPIEGFINYFSEIKSHNKVHHLLNELKIRKAFKEGIIFNNPTNHNSLDFFQETQFSFSALIQADKADAINTPIIDDDINRVKALCEIYPERLEQYISKFNNDSELNKVRTQIRKEVVKNITTELKGNNRVFELTAPTGSGKTIMLLSLATEIIHKKGDYRIIYALPFLSITEQVEKEVLEIFKDFKNEGFIQRIDSKSINPRYDILQKELDKNPDEAKMKELEFLAFQEQIFAYPFVITTFVQFFETLLSNKNSTLLKLPNLSKSIILIDEIQSLPPRLYSFFVAYLSKFCAKFDSYVVISTATQPNFKLQNKAEVIDFFKDYEPPKPLLKFEKYFESKVFNRYQIDYKKEPINLEELTQLIICENNSVLVIVNTIDDSKELFENLKEFISEDEVFLLNTHFTPKDRKAKIQTIKVRLKSNLKTILVSTQLIEAGVDIDFPILYRDFALVSSIVQSAGRCNRNGKMKKLGQVVVFNLHKNGKSRANLIYGTGKDKDILKFTKNAIGEAVSFQESELLPIQRIFFDRISQELNFGQHSQKEGKIEFNFINDMKDCAFDKIGKFQLIDEYEYGIIKQYFVADNEKDKRFETLLSLKEEMAQFLKNKESDIGKMKNIRIKIKNQLKDMANNIVSVRIKPKNQEPVLGYNEDCFDIWKVSTESYSTDNGIDLKGGEYFL